MLYLFGQVRETLLRQGMHTSSICSAQHVATGRSNARTTMLKYGALKCWDQARTNTAPTKRWQHLSETYRNIVGRSMLRAFRHPVVTCYNMLQQFGCCWLKFENSQIFHATFVDVACRCSRLARFVQQCWARASALAQSSKPNMSEHGAKGWPNECAQHSCVAFKCCNHLAGVCWGINVGICCAKMSRSFRRGLLGQPCCDMLR